MKRKIFFLGVLMFSLIVVFLPSHAAPANTATIPYAPDYFAKDDKESVETISRQVTMLPLALTIVDEGAFEGTALSIVNLGDAVTQIEDNAFANNPRLMKVWLPDSIQRINGNPFAGSQGAFLSGSVNSYAQKWARENGMRFFLGICFSNKKEAQQFVSGSIRKSDIEKKAECSNQRCVQEQRENNSGRTDGDVKIDAYGDVAALYIRSRYFP